MISNCVINLAPDKSTVFREIARVLEPGGRVAVSDIALKKPLPPELAESVAAWSGCIAGAISVDQYLAGLRAAALSDVVAVDDKSDLNVYAKVEGQSGCCSPAMSSSTLPIAGGSSCCSPAQPPTLHGELAAVLQRFDVNEFAGSFKVYAIKPR